jgi:DNA-binding PadR family transcriptional regulator
MTGYDLTMKINRFWRSTHSAIYPLLSELEDLGYVEFVLEKQSGKPDKKTYSLTPQGKNLLHEWFMSDTGDEVIRDEMMLKLYCIKCVSPEAAGKILDELEARCRRKIAEYNSLINKFRSMEHSEAAASSLFGSYILTQRALNEAKLDLVWCEWVRKLYEDKASRFWIDDFHYE